MSLRPALQSGKFVITSEVGPPKGTNVEQCLHEAEFMRGRVDAINVTDIQAAAMRLGSMVVCHLLKDRGFEPVLQMVCRDRNRLALQSDLLSAWVLGIENVLCLTGDHPKLGDHPGAKGVFDLDSVQLIAAAKGLNDGRDMAGNELDGKPDFCLAAVVTPGGGLRKGQIVKLKKKVDAGAEFIQTQAVYDADEFARFMEDVAKAGVNVPILAGIVLLKSAGMAKYMNQNVAGVHVPDDLVAEMAKAGKADKEAKERGEKGGNQVAASIRIAADLILKLKPLCQGVHIMPLGWDKQVPPVLDAAGL